MPILYLGGPINGCSDAEARDWRERVKRELAAAYRIVDPMDHDFRGHEAGNADQIVRRDKASIRRCQIALFHRWKASDGTAMEIHYAHGEGKRVVVIAAPPVSPWVAYHASVVVPTVDAAIAYLRGVA